MTQISSAKQKRQERIEYAFCLHFTNGVGIKEACKQAKIGTTTFYKAAKEELEKRDKTVEVSTLEEDIVMDFEAAVRMHETLGMREPEEHAFIELNYNVMKQTLLNKLSNMAKLLEIYTKHLLNQ